MPCGTTITTKTLDYNSAAAPSQPCGGIKPPAGTTSVNIVKVATADPLAANTAVAAAFTHLASVASLAGAVRDRRLRAATSMTFGYTHDRSVEPAANPADRDRLPTAQLRLADLDGHLSGGRDVSFRHHLA